MSFSKAKSSTSTSTTTTNLSRNLNIQDAEGITVADSSGVNIVQTDQGAIGAAEKIALASVAVGEELAIKGFEFGDAQLGRQTEFARGLFGDALTAVGNVVEQGQAQLGNTVTALNEIAREQATSADERVADLANNAIRYGLIGLGLVGAGLLAMRFAR